MYIHETYYVLFLHTTYTVRGIYMDIYRYSPRCSYIVIIVDNFIITYNLRVEPSKLVQTSNDTAS